MNFEPKTKEQIEDGKLWTKGEYGFEVVAAEEKKSAAGNDMFEVRVRVSNGNGASRTLTDYLLPKRAGKLYSCCAALGLLDKYRSGVLAADDFMGGRGKLLLAVEKGKNGYPPRNVIEDYISG
ncbi:MAG: hypothetical protein ACRD2G_18370 [Terriglobia bacterium]